MHFQFRQETKMGLHISLDTSIRSTAGFKITDSSVLKEFLFALSCLFCNDEILEIETR